MTTIKITSLIVVILTLIGCQEDVKPVEATKDTARENTATDESSGNSQASDTEVSLLCPSSLKIPPGQAHTTDSDALAPAEIDQAVGEHDDAIHECYYDALDRQPELSGNIKLAVVLGSSGKVNQVCLASQTIDDEEMTNCVVSAAKRNWRFPATHTGKAVTLKYPLHFDPDMPRAGGNPDQ